MALANVRSVGDQFPVVSDMQTSVDGSCLTGVRRSRRSVQRMRGSTRFTHETHMLQHRTGLLCQHATVAKGRPWRAVLPASPLRTLITDFACAHHCPNRMPGALSAQHCTLLARPMLLRRTCASQPTSGWAQYAGSLTKADTPFESTLGHGRRSAAGSVHRPAGLRHSLLSLGH
jgi:hypothetical protein